MKKLFAFLGIFLFISCSDDDSYKQENKMNSDEKEILQNFNLTANAATNLTYNIIKEVENINGNGYYEYLKNQGIDYRILDLLDREDIDRNGLEFLLINFDNKSREYALFVFDLKNEISLAKKSDSNSNLVYSTRGRGRWRCAQAIAMGTAVTLGAMGLTATSGGLAIGFFLISKAYSVQDILENC